MRAETYVHQDFSHLRDNEHNLKGASERETNLISALSATDVNHDVAVRVFRDSLRDDRFAAPESTRNRRCPSLHARKECVEDSLTGQEGVVRCMLLCCWSRRTNRPDLHHGVLGRLALEFGL